MNTKPFLDNIRAERATWTAHAIELAEILSASMSEWTDESTLLKREDSAIGDRANPRVAVLGELARRICSYRRALHGEAKDYGRRQLAKAVDDALR